MDKQKQMQQLKEEKGMSYQTIGELFGISRQRVHQIVSGYITTHNRKSIKNAELNEIFGKIFIRDNYICQLCKEKGILIHHIDKNWKNNNFNNLICLCNKCHLNLHRPKEASEMKKERNRKGSLGRKFSEDTIKKMREAAKKRIRQQINGRFI